MATDAQRKANAKYLASKKTLTIRLNSNDYERIRKGAADASLSIQKFITTLVLAYLDADKEDV